MDINHQEEQLAAESLGFESANELREALIRQLTSPSEEAIKKVMEETKMDYLQAYRHLQQRFYLINLKQGEFK